MTIKASGRSALILAAGLWIGLGTGFMRPSLAAAGDTGANGAAAAATKPDNSKHGSHHKKVAQRKSDRPADKSAPDAKAADTAAGAGADKAPAVQSSQISPTVANANAQLTSTDSPADSAKAMSERVNNILQGIPDDTEEAPPAAGAPVVAADQLNDVDRALHEATPPAAMASADAPAPASPPAVVAANNSDNSTWDQASLIGKIFIGFGALLTMASAARMFMA